MWRRIIRGVLCFLAILGAVSRGLAQEAVPSSASTATARGDRIIADYFRSETARLAAACLRDVRTREDWLSRRAEFHRQFRDMLGLDPLPQRTPLNPVVTGRVEQADFFVEKLHFQSLPGLYVTGNLYVPKSLTGPVPAILYVCGHGQVKKGDVSFGNKAHYQHHGGWFARNGYVCLTIDTIQLGEIEGIHHGTFQRQDWWWNARGYTPAGVEAWNGVRALDYLETRPEVDPERLGVTGRSGGGATSWWIAALDERVKVAVPVAGITDLENHVVDGVVDGHCDCMYLCNTYRWDYPLVAALVAPRPLLISNSDKDYIFPLEGVVRLHEKVRRIYRLFGADKQLGLHITEGPHSDTQELQVHAFRWFNRFLKGDKDSQISKTTEKFFQPAELRVFDRLPSDQIVTTIQETFPPAAPAPAVPESAADWAAQRDGWLAGLREKVFRGWPDEAAADRASLAVYQAFDVAAQGVRFAAYDFISQRDIPLRLYLAHRAGLASADLELIVLNASDQPGWEKWLSSMRAAFAEQFRDEPPVAANGAEFDQTRQMFQSFRWGMAWIAPRGVGPTAWDQSEKKQAQVRRRFQLLGQTLDGMRVWDVRRAAQALRSLDGLGKVPLWMQGERQMAGIVLYASLFEPDVARLDLWQLPASHRAGPDLLNVQRILDMPAALTLAAERLKIRLYHAAPADWDYTEKAAERLGWPKGQLQGRTTSDSD